jgi:hypothetical protein
MRVALKTGMIVSLLLVAPVVAQAGTLEGVGIGAATGAAIAGPPGAVIGGIIGGVTGGPNIVTRDRYNYRDDQYYRSDRSCLRDDRGTVIARGVDPKPA